MVRLSTFALALIASTVRAAPVTLNRRIAQVISASTAKWEQACIAAAGAQQCNPISVTAFSTLLAAAGACEQQNAADSMINLAKTLNNDAQMIKLAQIFAQQPRNTPTSQSVLYCQQAPKNTELNGLFQCQFAGANPTTFVGGVAVGQPGTIPFGLNAPLSPAGSCPANPNGPVPDGQQLVDITQNPGATAGNAASGNNSGSAGGAAGTDNSGDATETDCNDSTVEITSTVAAPAEATETPAPTTAAAGDNGGSFLLQNGKDAQALNAKFAGLTADSACSTGDNACVGTSFAQCVNGKFVTTACSGGLVCAALPLVNKAGTSITCTTTSDAEARIAATGATGGITGSGAAAPAASDATPIATTAAPAASSAPAPAVNASATGAAVGSDFHLQNGKDAQALNQKFTTLSATAACTTGEVACIGSSFAQCANGKFVTTACAGGLTCAALPLVNSPGTSVTCTTTADALARIQATGATGGVTGA
ncbi:hypothetical protein BDQ12DRAFT_698039 [Crucibulum laeve]|uniref:Carbohydrate-binding module family 19 domain-containing protein n=1 Tax=Crucibulum laeve TaxID=68775 RepID=A0A5C3M823_9AGAR|nr:hypothetical protein BDQ12DRAFT_698039 [Crucibulum laeve]